MPLTCHASRFCGFPRTKLGAHTQFLQALLELRPFMCTGMRQSGRAMKGHGAERIEGLGL